MTLSPSGVSVCDMDARLADVAELTWGDPDELTIDVYGETERVIRCEWSVEWHECPEARYALGPVRESAFTVVRADGMTLDEAREWVDLWAREIRDAIETRAIRLAREDGAGSWMLGGISEAGLRLLGWSR